MVILARVSRSAGRGYRQGIVISPSFSRFGAVALLPLVTATLFASYMLMNRALGTRDSPLVM